MTCNVSSVGVSGWGVEISLLFVRAEVDLPILSGFWGCANSQSCRESCRCFGAWDLKMQPSQGSHGFGGGGLGGRGPGTGIHCYPSSLHFVSVAFRCCSLNSKGSVTGRLRQAVPPSCASGNGHRHGAAWDNWGPGDCFVHFIVLTRVSHDFLFSSYFPPPRTSKCFPEPG